MDDLDELGVFGIGENGELGLNSALNGLSGSGVKTAAIPTCLWLRYMVLPNAVVPHALNISSHLVGGTTVKGPISISSGGEQRGGVMSCAIALTRSS